MIDGLGELAAGVDVRTHVLALADAAESCVFALHSKRLAVHDEQSHIALFSGRQVLLGDHKAVPRHGIDHLVEIRHIVGTNQEDAGASRALERFEYDRALLFGEGLDLGMLSRVISVRGRTSSGNSWRYILDEALASPLGSLSTMTPRRIATRPNSVATVVAHGRRDGVVRRHIAQHQDIKVVDA